VSTIKISFRTGIALVLWLSVGPNTGSTYAAEVSATNLALQKTTLKTVDTSLGLSTTPANAFSQSTINCPGTSGTCTVRVEVSSQFSDLTTGDVVVIGISVDGLQSGVKPSPTVTVHDTTSTGSAAGVRTFSWMKKGLGLGSHTVNAAFFVTPSNNAFANAGYRTLTLQVYK